MPHLPLLGRLSLLEYAYLLAGFLFLALESVLHIIILFLPKAFINLCYEKSRTLFNRRHRAERPPSSPEKQVVDKILRARDFHGLCEIYGYTPEEHVVLTKDGYLLTLHRLCNKKGEHSAHPGTSTGGPVVYLHHGLLMNSEIWVCLTAEERALPFQLVERGYDVRLGNNRCVGGLYGPYTVLISVAGATSTRANRSTMGLTRPSSGTIGACIPLSKYQSLTSV